LKKNLRQKHRLITSTLANCTEVRAVGRVPIRQSEVKAHEKVKKIG